MLIHNGDQEKMVEGEILKVWRKAAQGLRDEMTQANMCMEPPWGRSPVCLVFIDLGAPVKVESKQNFSGGQATQGNFSPTLDSAEIVRGMNGEQVTERIKFSKRQTGRFSQEIKQSSLLGDGNKQRSPSGPCPGRQGVCSLS